MKLKGYLGRSDGQVSGPIAGLVVGIVILFVGLFMVSIVAEVTPGLTVNAFTTVSNTTPIITGMAGNDTYQLSIGDIIDPTVDYIVVALSNTSTLVPGYNINVSLERVNIANIAVPATISETNITGVILIRNALNNLSFGNETAPDLNGTMIINASMVYAPSVTNTEFGDMSDAIIVTTGTIFSVLGLVIIVIALTMAIQSLSGVTRATK